ncbi:MAG: PAS domain-containing protein, partial [Clostridium sp.]
MELKTETLLRDERDHLLDILDHIPLPLFITDKDRNLNFINAAALDLFHCKKDMVGQPCHCLNTCICNTHKCAIEQM